MTETAPIVQWNPTEFNREQRGCATGSATEPAHRALISAAAPCKRLSLRGPEAAQTRHDPMFVPSVADAQAGHVEHLATNHECGRTRAKNPALHFQSAGRRGSIDELPEHPALPLADRGPDRLEPPGIGRPFRCDGFHGAARSLAVSRTALATEILATFLVEPCDIPEVEWTAAA
jgi:hypothetical protein